MRAAAAAPGTRRKANLFAQADAGGRYSHDRLHQGELLVN